MSDAPRGASPAHQRAVASASAQGLACSRSRQGGPARDKPAARAVVAVTIARLAGDHFLDQATGDRLGHLDAAVVVHRCHVAGAAKAPVDNRRRARRAGQGRKPAGSGRHLHPRDPDRAAAAWRGGDAAMSRILIAEDEARSRRFSRRACARTASRSPSPAMATRRWRSPARGGSIRSSSTSGCRAPVASRCCGSCGGPTARRRSSSSPRGTASPIPSPGSRAVPTTTWPTRVTPPRRTRREGHGHQPRLSVSSRGDGLDLVSDVLACVRRQRQPSGIPYGWPGDSRTSMRTINPPSNRYRWRTSESERSWPVLAS